LFRNFLRDGDEDGAIRILDCNKIPANEMIDKLVSCCDIADLRKYSRLISKLYELQPSNPLMMVYCNDPIVRMTLVKDFFDKAKTKDDTAYRASLYVHSSFRRSRHSSNEYKVKFQQILMTDPEPVIRQALVESTTNTFILNSMAETDNDENIRSVAKLKAVKLEKRNAYMKARNEAKKALKV
jgi:hypothetical protein